MLGANTHAKEAFMTSRFAVAITRSARITEPFRSEGTLGGVQSNFLLTSG